MIYGVFIDDSLYLDIFINLHGLSKMILISLIAFSTSRKTKDRINYIDFHLAYISYLLFNEMQIRSFL